jgi:hypothetical protein
MSDSLLIGADIIGLPSDAQFLHCIDSRDRSPSQTLKEIADAALDEATTTT